MNSATLIVCPNNKFIGESMIAFSIILYLTLQYAGPEVRWVDSQKNVFRMSSRLVSSVLTGDQHLHNFFQTTSGLMTPPQTPTIVNGAATPNPFANAFSSAINNPSAGGGGLSTSSSGVMVENGLAGEGLAGAYRKRTESGSGDVGGELVVQSGGGIDTLSAISAISAISPAISTPKSSRSSSVSTLVGSGSIRTGPSDAETVRNLKVTVLKSIIISK